jgi:hypothetical protein
MTALMTATTKKIRELVRLELDELARLRDEIRLDVQLASMEDRRTWAGLEKQFERLEETFGSGGDYVADTTRQIAAEVRSAFRGFERTLLSERRTEPDLPSIR